MKSQVKKIAKKKMLSANLDEYVQFLSLLATNRGKMSNRLSQS
jgi:hypothetical protein